VLSHELRTPLTVLQGYLRLLQRGSATNTAHVSAMLEATAQLAALGRQASELAAALRPAPAVSGAPPLSVSDFLEGLRALSTALNIEISADLPGLDHQTLACADTGRQVERAVITIASAIAREAEAPRALIDVACAGGSREVVLRVSAVSDARLPAASSAAADRPWFLAGGFGLALVSASLVCDAHGAAVSWGGAGQPTFITLRLAPAS
jgi:signal transduction histidine kinase